MRTVVVIENCKSHHLIEIEDLKIASSLLLSVFLFPEVFQENFYVQESRI